jgi:hypothetical protein
MYSAVVSVEPRVQVVVYKQTGRYCSISLTCVSYPRCNSAWLFFRVSRVSRLHPCHSKSVVNCSSVNICILRNRI